MVAGSALPSIDPIAEGEEIAHYPVKAPFDGTIISKDVVIDERGQVIGYDLTAVFVEGPVAWSRQVPTEAVRSLSRDALLVDLAQVQR